MSSSWRNRTISILFCAITLCLFAISCDLFPRDDPADPEGTNYQGFPNVASVNDVAPVAPAADLSFPPELKGSKVIGGDRYRFQIASDLVFSAIEYDQERSNNIFSPTDWMPSAGPGIYWFRLMARKAGTWGPWSKAQTFTLKSSGTVATLTITPVAGLYTSSKTITCSTTTPSATIRYTTDGSTPTLNTGTEYGGPFLLEATATIKAVAFKPGWVRSGTASSAYTITGTVATPTFSPVSGTYNDIQSVTISSSTEGATIRYTTDGSSPSKTLGTVYASPIPITATNKTIKAIAYKTDWLTSAIASETYSLQVASPAFSLVEGEYSNTQTVSISCATVSATIRYTTDGSVPTTTSSVYSTPIPVATTKTIKAIAYKTDFLASSVVSATYTLKAATPAFSPVEGVYTTSQTVSISSSTASATIRYTIDGSTPTSTVGTIYSTAIAVSSTKTLKAIAYKTGWSDSEIGSASYTITGTVPTPTFSPTGGTYTSGKSVAISCSLSGSSIRYTTNGTTPSPVNGTVYSEPIGISVTTTLKAIAYKTEWANSAVASASYTITGTVGTPAFSIPAGTYYEAQNVTISCATSDATIRYTTNGTDPTPTSGTIYNGIPITVSTTQTLKAIAYKTDWADSPVSSALYTIRYSVLYDGNGNTGGSVPVDGNWYLAGANVTVAGNTDSLVKVGFEFAGWNTATNGSGTDRAVGSTFVMGSGNVVLYARWFSESVTMVAIPRGSFQMGSPLDIGYDNERPIHSVTLTGFRMGKHEVTQGQYLAVTGSNPSKFNSGSDAPTRPVEMVTWYDAVEFCNKLSVLDGFTPVYTITGRYPATTYPITYAMVTQDMTKNGYRLPTEAEWEYAARGGNGSPGGYTYSGSDDIGTVAWYDSNSGVTTHTVGMKAGNGLGLYDMSGNVWEWCQDWLGAYGSDPQTDPMGASSGSYLVRRGGSWSHDARSCRLAHRDCGGAWAGDYNAGFRVVRRP